jgi:RHS repeat-associated protein
MFYTFTDHLGTPLIQTDSTTAVVWRTEHEPYGNVYLMRKGARPDQPLRFPGQELAMSWEGTEENYNIFRWYGAGWGRYTQADPLGLRGGMNLFHYVHARPIVNFDPLGLVEWTCDFNVFGFGEVVGGAALKATCTSPCVNHQRIRAVVVASIFGVTFGLPVSHTIASGVIMDDGQASAAAANLAGYTSYHAGGANVISGCGQTDFKLGKAKGSTGFSCSWWAGLISAGLDNYAGDGEVKFSNKECCQ